MGRAVKAIHDPGGSLLKGELREVDRCHHALQLFEFVMRDEVVQLVLRFRVQTHRLAFHGQFEGSVVPFMNGEAILSAQDEASSRREVRRSSATWASPRRTWLFTVPSGRPVAFEIST